MTRLPTTFTTHNSFTTLASLYDGFILDQFGVMHNGKHALDGANECIQHLISQEKKLIVLSNTSSPSETALSRLPKLGFDRSHFIGAVTSGEEAIKHIAKNYGAGKKRRKALWITWASRNISRPLDFLSKCGDGIEIVDSVEEAEFVILHGAECVRGKGEDGVAMERSLGNFVKEGSFHVIDEILDQCLQKDLPMICANPDFVVMLADGVIAHMPGKIAKRYESIGGKCTYFGKPHVPHFEACIQRLNLPKHRIAHVGDSLHHDIAGANASGIDSIFVTGGVHLDEVGGDLGDLPDMDVLHGLFEKEGVFPTHVVPMFRF